MDRLEALGNQLSQITMYDIKSMYTQVLDIQFIAVQSMNFLIRPRTWS